MKITFAPLAESHFPLLLKWLQAPHIKKWWDQDVTYTLELVREKYSSYIEGYKFMDGQQKPIQGFIIHNNQNPVGYIFWAGSVSVNQGTSASDLDLVIVFEVEEAIANGADAVQCWIFAAKEKGREIPESDNFENQSGKWVQRVPRSLHARLTRRAKREHVSLNTLVVSILSESLGFKSNGHHQQGN